MKKILTVMLILTVSVMAELQWQANIPAALELAKKENKIVMVFVEGKECRWCKKMKHRILSDEKVEKRLQPYTLVKVFQEDKEGMNLLPNIQGVPTIFFMTPDKKVLEEVIGYFDVDDFISYIDSVETKVKK